MTIDSLQMEKIGISDILNLKVSSILYYKSVLLFTTPDANNMITICNNIIELCNRVKEIEDLQKTTTI